MGRPKQTAEAVRYRILNDSIPEPNSGCWLWLGAVTNSPDERPTIRWQGRQHVRVYRLAYELFVRPLREGEVVMHKCDVSVCVNPDHLRAGTQLENIEDMMKKDRHAYKIPPDVDVFDGTVGEIAAKYGVTRKAVLYRRRTAK